MKKRTLIIIIMAAIILLLGGTTTTIVLLQKDHYDTTLYSFVDKTIEYDGNVHSLEISGTLPEGLSVKYTTNTLKDVGKIEVTATFIEEKGYEEVPDLTAVLTIVPRVVTITANDVHEIYSNDIHDNSYTVTKGSIIPADLESLEIKPNLFKVPIWHPWVSKSASSII